MPCAALSPESSRARSVAWAALIYGIYFIGAGVVAVELWYQSSDSLTRTPVWPRDLPPAILIGTGLVLVVTSIGLLRLQAWARTFLEAYAWLGIVLVPLTRVASLTEFGRDWGARDFVFGLVLTLGQFIAMCVVLHFLRSSSVRDAVR